MIQLFLMKLFFQLFRSLAVFRGKHIYFIFATLLLVQEIFQLIKISDLDLSFLYFDKFFSFKIA